MARKARVPRQLLIEPGPDLGDDLGLPGCLRHGECGVPGGGLVGAIAPVGLVGAGGVAAPFGRLVGVQRLRGGDGGRGGLRVEQRGLLTLPLRRTFGSANSLV